MAQPNKARLRLWVEQLRSGTYRQGSNVLAGKWPLDDEFRYCCLGVACEVAVRHGAEVVVERDKGLKTYDGQQLLLPASVVEWFGLEHNNPYLRPDYSSASNLNDNFMLSFNEIADAIEQTFDLREETNG